MYVNKRLYKIEISTMSQPKGYSVLDLVIMSQCRLYSTSRGLSIGDILEKKIQEFYIVKSKTM